MIGRQTIGRRRCVTCQGSQVQGRESVKNSNLVGSIRINGLIQRECHIIAIERRVGCRVVLCDERVVEARDELLQVAETLCSADWRRETLIAVESDIECLLEDLEILFVEEAAKFGVAQGDSLPRSRGSVAGRRPRQVCISHRLTS